MKIYIGADHRGFTLKQSLKPFLQEQGVEVVDLGAAEHIDGDDYVDYAAAVGTEIAKDPESRGIVICGSGVGVDMVANKIKGVRSGLGIAEDQVTASRKDDDINVLAIAADYTLPEEVRKMVRAFITTPFSDEPRYQARIDKVNKLEN